MAKPKLPIRFAAWGTTHVFDKHVCIGCGESDVFLARFADDKSVRKLGKQVRKRRLRKLAKRQA